MPGPHWKVAEYAFRDHGGLLACGKTQATSCTETVQGHERPLERCRTAASFVRACGPGALTVRNETHCLQTHLPAIGTAKMPRRLRQDMACGT